ncbi:MAG TPA: glutamate--tRNA ligase [Patescibacteria group bacterium]|nr:glutamate--tRNA ligase [Patescibacteria group bacterium]
MSNVIRTRFAPSPTGYMHIGNLRTAIYEYLVAKTQNGQFILRIEDTDQARLVDGAVDVIYQTLQIVGLDYDEGPDKDGGYGPYVQSERRVLYKEYAEKLVELGGAYYCFCTRERLDAARQNGGSSRYDGFCRDLSKEEIAQRLAAGEPYVIRQKIPPVGQAEFYDQVYGHIVVDNSELDEGVLLKTDGLPTYNFANVIDDHLMDITHVIRGSEYLSSTPKYNLIYQSFQWEIPVYIHLPPIMKSAEKKLSKREGDASFEDFINKGYLKDAIVNYIVLLGWSPGTDEEIFSLEDLKQKFSVQGLSKSPAIFDPNKLRWMNSEYIRRMAPEEFHRLASPYYQLLKERNLDGEKVSRLLQTRVEVLGEIPGMLEFLHTLPEYDTELFVHKKMKTDQAVSLPVLKKIQEALSDFSDWELQPLHDRLMSLVGELGLKNSQVLWPLRVALSGLPSSPGGAMDLADILGKTETLRRLALAIGKLEAHLSA